MIWSLILDHSLKKDLWSLTLLILICDLDHFTSDLAHLCSQSGRFRPEWHTGARQAPCRARSGEGSMTNCRWSPTWRRILTRTMMATANRDHPLRTTRDNFPFNYDSVLIENSNTVQSWPKKCVLGCVIPPAGAVARSRNLGQTFLANSVHTSRI